MAFKNLPEHLKDSTCVFEGSKFDVHLKDIPGKNGGTLRREIAVHPGAVVILPFLQATKIILIRNYRIAIGKTLFELPAGTLEPNEQPIETARRELIEETGYQCDQIEPLINFYTSPGFCTEMMFAFLARELHFVGQKLNDSEEIEVEIFSLEEALDMIKHGSICDAKTIATLLYYSTFLDSSGLNFID